MAGTIIADNLQAASTSQLVVKNGVANTPPTIQDSGGTEVGTFCRAWVNFNGTGTVAIRASFNVSSITDSATGKYLVNFTNAMPDANYAVQVSVGNTTGSLLAKSPQLGGSNSASQVDVNTFLSGGADTDVAVISVSVFR